MVLHTLNDEKRARRILVYKRANTRWEMDKVGYCDSQSTLLDSRHQEREERMRMYAISQKGLNGKCSGAHTIAWLTLSFKSFKYACVYTSYLSSSSSSTALPKNRGSPEMLLVYMWFFNRRVLLCKLPFCIFLSFSLSLWRSFTLSTAGHCAHPRRCIVAHSTQTYWIKIFKGYTWCSL